MFFVPSFHWQTIRPHFIQGGPSTLSFIFHALPKFLIRPQFPTQPMSFSTPQHASPLSAAIGDTSTVTSNIPKYPVSLPSKHLSLSFLRFLSLDGCPVL